MLLVNWVCPSLELASPFWCFPAAALTAAVSEHAALEAMCKCLRIPSKLSPGQCVFHLETHLIFSCIAAFDPFIIFHATSCLLSRKSSF